MAQHKRGTMSTEFVYTAIKAGEQAGVSQADVEKVTGASSK